MPTPRRVCPKPGCPNLQPCTTHEAADRARRNERVKQYGYSSANWQRVRKQRHAIANGFCELRLDGCTINASHTHLDPRLQGDHRAATINDVVACCANCSGAIDAPRSHRGGGVDTALLPAAVTRARPKVTETGLVF
jgi:hypothetical protein